MKYKYNVLFGVLQGQQYPYPVFSLQNLTPFSQHVEFYQEFQHAWTNSNLLHFQKPLTTCYDLETKTYEIFMIVKNVITYNDFLK